MQKSLKYLLLTIFVFSIIACKDKAQQISKPITLNDTSTIVTETDSNFLKNNIEDITPAKYKQNNQDVSASLRQIDLDKKKDALQEQSVVDSTAKGTKVDLGEGCIVQVGLIGEITKIGSKYVLKSNSSAENVQLKVSGLENCSIQQRVFTNLAITIAGANYFLSELPVSTGPWATLPSKNNLFISLDKSAYSFSNADNRKILLATDRELRKAGKGRVELESAAKEIANTNTANDAPCKIIFNSCQWKISGTAAGKPFEKTIQLETK